jgi:ABC-2 type transport system ATP-binding protein
MMSGSTMLRDFAAERAPTLMQVAGLTKHYGDQRALTEVSFDVHPREVLGLIGPNGAGKTTLLESIAGLLPVEAGRLFWRGTPLSSTDRRQVIFYLPDGLRPWDDQFVIQVLTFFASVYRRSETDIAAIVRSVGLHPVLGKRVSALSKGFGRRLMLALALITPHPVLLMDEPFDGFDLRQVRQIMRVLRDVAAAGRALVLAIHQLTDAERVCDRFVLLADGTARGIGTLDELRARIGNPTAGLEEVFLALA